MDGIHPSTEVAAEVRKLKTLYVFLKELLHLLVILHIVKAYQSSLKNQ